MKEIDDERWNIDLTAMAETTTPDLNIPLESCLIPSTPDPCTIVIVGASGDLTARKLVPALFNLYLNSGLPEPFLIVGCARTNMSDQEFKDKIPPDINYGFNEFSDIGRADLETSFLENAIDFFGCLVQAF